MCPLLQSSVGAPETAQHKPSLPKQPRYLPQGLDSRAAVQGEAHSMLAGAHRLCHSMHACIHLPQVSHDECPTSTGCRDLKVASSMQDGTHADAHPPSET